MRHIIIRFVITLVWLVVAIVCLVNGKTEMLPMYALMFVVFAYTTWKGFKARNNGGNR